MAALAWNFQARSVTEVYVVSPDKNLYLWNGSAFSLHSSLDVGSSVIGPANASRVSIVVATGRIYCIDRTTTHLKYWDGSNWVDLGGTWLELSASTETEIYLLTFPTSFYLLGRIRV